MRLVADEGVDRGIVTQFREQGHEITCIAEMAQGAPDATVLRLASESSAVLVTSDKDFGELVFRRGQASHGVLLLRLVGLSAAGKARLVAGTVAKHGEKMTGCFSVLTPRSFRVRHLPSATGE